MGKKKTTTTSNATTSGTATTTPNLFEPAVKPTSNYFTAVENTFANSNPWNYVTPANDLLKSAYSTAATLTQPNAALTDAANMARNMANTSAPTYSASTVSALPTLQAERAGLVRAGTANSYNIADLPGAMGYQAALAGGINLSGQAQQAQAQSMLDNFGAYYNPATQALVDTTLTGFDQNAQRARAQMEAEAAKGGAFGGSRYGLQLAQTATDMAQQRAATEAQLRAQAFNAAAGLSQYDTSNRQQTQLFNAGAQNAREEALAQLQAANNQFNAGQQNAARQLFANANNQFGLAGFDAENTARQFNAGAQNQFSLADAAAANQLNMFNSGQANSLAMQQAQLQQEVNLANARAEQEAAAGNANLRLAQNGQNLGAVGTYADISNDAWRNTLDGTNTMLGAGTSLYGIEDAYNKAPLTFLENYGSLLNPALINATSGSTTNTSGTSNESGTKTESGGLLNGLLSGAFQLGSAWIGK